MPEQGAERFEACAIKTPDGETRSEFVGRLTEQTLRASVGAKRTYSLFAAAKQEAEGLADRTWFKPKRHPIHAWE